MQLGVHRTQLRHWWVYFVEFTVLQYFTTLDQLTNRLTEGLALNFTSTSSLTRVADYQNASIYLDISGNSAFASFKVGQER